MSSTQVIEQPKIEETVVNTSVETLVETPVETPVETSTVETPVEEPETKVSEASEEDSTESTVEASTPAEICALFPDLQLAENADRVLIKQGYLSSKNGFKTSKRAVYLFSDYAVFAKKSGKGSKAMVSLKQVIELSSASMGASKSKAVVICTAGRSFKLQAKSADEAKEWNDMFTAQIAACAPVVEEPASQEPAEEPAKVSEVVEEEVAKVSEVVEEEVAKVSEVVEAAVEEVAVEEAAVEEAAVEEAKVSEVVDEEVAKVSEVVETAVEETKPSEVVAESEVAEVKESEVVEEAVEGPKVELTEEQQVVADIMAQFPAETLSENADRFLVKQGDLSRTTRFKTSARKMYLFNDFVVLASVKGKKAKVELKQVLDLAQTTMTKVGKADKINFTSADKDFQFKAASAEELDQWTAVLTDTINSAKVKHAAAKAVAVGGGGEALMAAVMEGNVEVLTSLLDQKADAAFKNEEGLTAVHVAALQGNVEIIKLMAEKGYALDEQDAEGRTAFQVAAVQGHTRVQSVTNAFMGAGVDHGHTILCMAAGANQVQSVMALIASGADMNTADAEGKIAIHYAAQSGSMDTLKVLVDAGANVNARDAEGNTPLSLATEEVKEYLVAAGARAGKKGRFPSVIVGSKVANKADWVADKSSKTCLLCSSKFSFFTRRHHCRACGVLCCSPCSSNIFITKDIKKPMRACNGCFNVMRAELTQQVEEAKEEAAEAVQETAEEAQVAVEDKVEEVVAAVTEVVDNKVEDVKATVEDVKAEAEEVVEETKAEVTVEEPKAEETVEEPKVEEEVDEAVKEEEVEAVKEVAAEAMEAVEAVVSQATEIAA